MAEEQPPSPVELRARLANLQQKRASGVLKERGQQETSLDGLRLSRLLKQLEALQAVQGLTELRPKDRGKKNRFTIPDDPVERDKHRQWLRFKAEWLEALLEDAIDELAALEDAQSPAKADAETPSSIGAGTEPPGKETALPGSPAKTESEAEPPKPEGGS